MDDEDRENEGDLVMAADCVRPEDINFMARFGRGLICLTLTRERCAQLRLPLMVSDTDRTQRTNFTLSIEAAEGVTTGISAHDRAHTVRTAVRPDAQPEHLRQPGHVFPIMAQPGGVLTRAGHTEAGCDLARLAGFEPAAVIVEIMNDDGTMARRPELEAFARRHQLKIGTIADLIRHRLQTERSVERIAEQTVSTAYGEFRLYCYEDHVNRDVHLALVHGDLDVRHADRARACHRYAARSGRRARRLAGLDAAGGAAAHRALAVRRGHHPAPARAAARAGRRGASAVAPRCGARRPRPLSGRVLRTYGVGAQILQRPGRAAHARAVGADAAARHLGIRAGDRRLRRRERLRLRYTPQPHGYRGQINPARLQRANSDSPSLPRATTRTSSRRCSTRRACRLAACTAAPTRHCGSNTYRAHSSCRWRPGAWRCRRAVDAVVALGCVIRGDTAHFDYVAGECAYGLQRVMLDTGVPVSFGVLTVDTRAQALERAAPDSLNKGGEALETALAMASLLRRLK